MSVKILISYHKPAYPFKNTVLTPIHVGRDLALSASKDKILMGNEYQWLLKNMDGDNTGENISALNRKYNELTAQYWAWKNYDKLGDPDSIGFCHYRRHFVLNPQYHNSRVSFGCYEVETLYENYLTDIGLTPQQITKTMDNCDVLAFAPVDLQKDFPPYMPKNLTPRTNYAYYNWLDIKDFDKAIEILKQKYPSFAHAADEYIHGHIMYGYNIFVMKKEIFMDYSAWLFDILFEMDKHIDWENKTTDGYRALGFIAEQLHGIYIYKLIKDKKYKIKHAPLTFVKNISFQEEIRPAFAQNNIPILLASDENYVPHLTTTIQSIVVHADAHNNYDFIVLEENIQPEIKNLIQQHFSSYKNISIRFYNMDYLIDTYTKDLFYICAHFSRATYYRFFIPQICRHYDKVLYLDCDLIVQTDIARLYHTNLSGHMLAACKEYLAQSLYVKEPSYKEYMDKTLKLKDIKHYFNAGVLVCNLSKMISSHFTQACIDKLKEIKSPKTVDQDILNSVCEGEVLYLPLSWNYCWHPRFSALNLLKQSLPYKDFNQYNEAYISPYLIHYTSEKKPWNDNMTADLSLSSLWWRYARQTPFYEELLRQMINASVNRSVDKPIYKSILWTYYRCKILSKITWGNKRRHYKQKRNRLHEQVRQIRNSLKH